jgi:antirestriction protein ArdC
VEKSDIYRTVTDAIVAALESGVDYCQAISAERQAIAA